MSVWAIIGIAFGASIITFIVGVFALGYLLAYATQDESSDE